jgi:hypothetical protein
MSSEMPILNNINISGDYPTLKEFVEYQMKIEDYKRLRKADTRGARAKKK